MARGAATARVAPTHMTHNPIAYRRIAEAARANADGIVRRWLPDGKRIGHEWASIRGATTGT
jgi:hypothetical protein